MDPYIRDYIFAIRGLSSLSRLVMGVSSGSFEQTFDTITHLFLYSFRYDDMVHFPNLTHIACLETQQSVPDMRNILTQHAPLEKFVLLRHPDSDLIFKLVGHERRNQQAALAVDDPRVSVFALKVHLEELQTPWNLWEMDDARMSSARIK